METVKRLRDALKTTKSMLDVANQQNNELLDKIGNLITESKGLQVKLKQETEARQSISIYYSGVESRLNHQVQEFSQECLSLSDDKAQLIKTIDGLSRDKYLLKVFSGALFFTALFLLLT